MAFIYYITQIQFDFGAVKLLKAECERVGISRPLVVTDAGVKAAGVLQKALDVLTDMPVTVFDQTPSNPTEAAVRAAAAALHPGGPGHRAGVPVGAPGALLPPHGKRGRGAGRDGARALRRAARRASGGRR